MAESRALESNYKRWPMGAVLVRGGRVLASASNDLRNPANMDGVPFEECSTHAEVATLRRVRSAAGSTIYIARVLRTGGRGLAKPCAACQRDLVSARVRQAIWTIDEHSYGTTVLRGMTFDDVG
jgi:tRNA(Arg) A34 adenosine deaminase TadA